MKWSIAAFGFAASAIAADSGAAVTGNVKPDSPPPGGCSTSRDGKFQVSIYSLGNSKRDLQKRACGGEGTLVMTLQDGVLKDAKDRKGYVASNYQFQFDGPPQAGALFTAGFSLCNNGSLALGGSTVFYRCLSGDFYNLYDRHWAPQCDPIEIVASFCDGGNNGGSGGDGGNAGNKPVGTSLVQSAVLTVIADGQPQVRTTVVPVPMCQIGDGQVQVRTTPCASIAPASQVSGGQPQAPTPPPPVSQISDGQIQAPPKTAAPPPPINQISDGQPQAPNQPPAAPAVSQISDGQPQAATKSAPAVNQISDGQPQAPAGTLISTSTSTPVNTPSNTPAPTQVAAAEKVFPAVAAVAAAFFGIVLL